MEYQKIIKVSKIQNEIIQRKMKKKEIYVPRKKTRNYCWFKIKIIV